MREIKFRAWSKALNRYVDPWDFMVEGTGEVFVSDDFGHDTRPKHLILEQYTGLKDKNGKEIFEGDIVLFKDMYHLEETKEYRLEVYFNEYGEWCAGNMLLSRLFTEKTLEVVGNIHQNADLLEVENEN